MSAIHQRSGCQGIRRASLRPDFPVLCQSQDLHYLDNAATAQKPHAVIDAMTQCLSQAYAPVHRGLYPLAEQATESYEAARQQVAQFIGASSAHEVVFTRSATESINMVANGWMGPRLRPGDRIWVTRMEHHANYLPWQRVCQQTGAELCVLELDAAGALDFSAEAVFGPRTRLIALCHVSNVLGVENPVAEVCAKARAQGIPVLVDAAQSVAHVPLHVQQMDCDFLAFSGHKMYGPSGIGVLYARDERLQEMAPLLVGGSMVDHVGEGVSASSWAEVPARFEAGSPNLPGAVGLAAAVEYLQQLDRHAMHRHITDLGAATAEALQEVPGLRILPSADAPPSGIVSFTIDGLHPHDIAQIAAEHGVAIRAGHHCAQPLLRKLGIDATARASFGVYNDCADVNALASAVRAAQQLFTEVSS